MKNTEHNEVEQEDVDAQLPEQPQEVEPTRLPTNPEDRLNTALALAERGMRIIPLGPRGKVPAIKQWQLRATTDEMAIRKWAAIHVGSNFGMATGKESGVFVVDIDPKDGGERTWHKIVADHKIPKTMAVITGSGGKHIYFEYPTTFQIGNSASKLGQGVDIRGTGGQVVIPPAIHPNGNLYKWAEGVDETTKVAKAPKWLLDLVEQASKRKDLPGIGDDVPEGGRNDAMYSHALALAKGGADVDFIIAQMLAWRDNQGWEDIEDDEVIETSKSAYKYAKTRQMDANNEVMLWREEKNDVTNAKKVVEYYGEDIRYVENLGWHIWSGKFWERDPEGIRARGIVFDTMSHLMRDILGMMQDNPTDQALRDELRQVYKWANTTKNVYRAESTLKALQTRPGITLNPSVLDGPGTTYLFNCANGVLDLETGELLKHEDTRHLYITQYTDIPYIPDAKAPAWEHTLELAFDGNRGLIDYFQRAIGYSTSGDTSEQCFFICHGESGNNGKSTLLETVHKVLGGIGPGTYAQMADAKVISSAEQGNNYILATFADMRGARVVSINEISARSTLDEELIKQMTGGDTVRAKYLYSQPFSYVPAFKIWMRANNKPEVRGQGPAFWRRVKMIPFEAPIPPELRKPRSQVDRELKEELPGILAWMVEGFKAWKSSGLNEPEQVKVAGTEYRIKSNIVAQFLEECVVEKPGSVISHRELYAFYTNWAREEGMRYPLVKNRFSALVAKELKQSSGQKSKPNQDGSSTKVWNDIAISASARSLDMAV